MGRQHAGAIDFMPGNKQGRPRYLTLIVCDDESVAEARQLAGEVGLPLCVLGSPEELLLQDVAHVIVEMNMRNPASVIAMRRFLAKLPADVSRCFVVDNGSATYASRVQANALGATRHILRNRAAIELRRQLSSIAAVATPLAPAKRALIAASPGGRSVLSAGRSIASAFEGFVDGNPLQVEAISAASADLLADVSNVDGQSWLNTVREHHEGTFQHCLLVAGVAATYAAKNGISGYAATMLVNAALLHDVGKATVPQQVLDKPGKLTESEFALIKGHPRAGYDYLTSHAELPEAVLDAVLHHHEALDGSGYPDGLSGPQIPPLTRILTVCDIFAAMVEKRSYKSAEPPSSAIMTLVDMALRSRVDYEAVRRLAGAFGTTLPDSLEELAVSLNQPVRARA